MRGLWFGVADSLMGFRDIPALNPCNPCYFLPFCSLVQNESR